MRSYFRQLDLRGTEVSYRLWQRSRAEGEPTIQTAAGGNNAYLSAIEGEGKTGNPSAGGYTVTATAASGHTFTIERKSTGAVERTCTPVGEWGAKAGGCVKGTW